MIDINNEQYMMLTQEFYSDRIVGVEDKNSYERRAKQVGWKSYEVQCLAFKTATDSSQFNWKNITNVLDIGCGYGTLVEYLREERSFLGKYTGIEILPEFLKEAKKLYGSDPRNQFIRGNFFTQKWEEKYDVVISLGILSVNYDWSNEYGEKSKYYARKAINLMSYLAQIGMSIYFPKLDNCDASVIQRNANMAFYQHREIRQMIEDASGNKYKRLTIESFPEVNSVRGVARVSFI